MYQLTLETETSRTYRNPQTGTEVTTVLKYTDEDGMKWWAFADLFAIPAIRKIASQKVAQLYGTGVTLDDLQSFIAKHKATLQSTSTDKHERAYADLLNFETLVEQTADPVKQSLALCTIYVLGDDEKIDVFSMQTAGEKMQAWALKPDVQAFFLSWWMDGINPYMQLLRSTSPTASTRESLTSAP